jgi:hypothetical protein
MEKKSQDQVEGKTENQGEGKTEEQIGEDDEGRARGEDRGQVEPQPPGAGAESRSEPGKMCRNLVEVDSLGELTSYDIRVFRQIWKRFVYFHAVFILILAILLGWAMASDHSPKTLTVTLMSLAAMIEIRGILGVIEVILYAKRHGIDLESSEVGDGIVRC